MTERDRLRALEVRVARHQPLGVPLGLRGQRVDQLGEAEDRLPRRVPAVEPQVERDLVVARSPGVQRGTGRRELRQATFDGGVDVLVGVLKLELAAVELALDPSESTFDRGQLALRDDPGRRKAMGVREAAGDVVRIELEVDCERG